MATFQKVKLGDVANVIPGFAFKSSDFSNLGKPILKIKNIKSDFSVSLEDCDHVKNEVFGKKNLDKYKIKPKEILVAMTGATIGKVGRFTSNQEIYLNQRVALFRPINIDNNYLWALLRSSKYQKILKNLGAGAAQANMSSFQIEKIEIEIPDLSTQTHISSVLSTYDDLIENNKKRIKTLEEMAQRLYTEWFVKFKFPDHEKIPMVDSGTEHGMIPEGWEGSPFTEIADIQSGGTPKTEIPEYWNGTIPFFTPKDAIESGYILNTEKQVTELGLKKCNSKLYGKDTIFITARGTVGKVCIAASDMAMNQSCYALVGKAGFSQFFVYQQITNAVESLKHRAHGAVFATIIVDTFNKLFVIKPIRNITINYSLLVTPWFKEMLNLKKKNLALTQTRDLLIPQLVTGKRILKV